MEVNSAKKEAYFTATQMQLVRTRFFGNRTAMIAGSILLFKIASTRAFFASFLLYFENVILENSLVLLLSLISNLFIIIKQIQKIYHLYI